MKGKLQNLKIAILLTDGFEETEMTKPREALKKVGATVHLITSNATKVTAWFHGKWSKQYKVDVQLKDADYNDYDALLLPGGVLNPDKLRTNKEAVKFVKTFLKKHKIIAAICHGPIILIETGKLKGRKMTSYHSIKTDLINAGAIWKNKPIVIDKNIITSREPKDLPIFNKTIINALSKHSKLK
jgi:protease I